MPTAPAAKPVRTAAAVIVGVGNYSNATIRPLAFAASDARAFHGVLADHHVCGFDTLSAQLLCDGEASAGAIRKAISNWLPQHSDGVDLAVIYLAGHGDELPVGNRKVGFFIPHDSDPDDPHSNVSMDLIRDWIGVLKAKAVLVCLDCCHAAHYLLRGMHAFRSLQATVSMPPVKSTFMIASCKSDEKSIECGKRGQGLFTHFLIEGIRGEAKADEAGRISIDTLFKYVAQQVQQSAISEFNNHSQNPLSDIQDIAGGHYISSPCKPAGPVSTYTGRLGQTLHPVLSLDQRETDDLVKLLHEAKLDLDEGKLQEILNVFVERCIAGDLSPCVVPYLVALRRHPADGIRHCVGDLLKTFGRDLIYDEVKRAFTARAGKSVWLNEKLLRGLAKFAPSDDLLTMLETVSPVLADELKSLAGDLVELVRLGNGLAHVRRAFRKRQPNWEIDRALGGGVLSSAYLVKDNTLPQLLVVRIIRKELLTVPGITEAFTRSNRRSAGVRSKHFVSTHFADAIPEKKLYFVTRDHVEGITLRDELQSSGPFDLPRVVHILGQVLEGLSAFEEMDRYHLGIKPSNIFLRKDGRVVLGDVGPEQLPVFLESKHLERLAYDYRYLAPEVILNVRPLTVAADWYSLACVAYEMLCGHPPFVAASHNAISGMHLHAKPGPVVRGGSPLVGSLQSWLDSLLEKNPKDRGKDTRSLIDALAKLNRFGPTGGVSPPPAREDGLQPAHRPLMTYGTMQNIDSEAVVWAGGKEGGERPPAPSPGPAVNPALTAANDERRRAAGPGPFSPGPSDAAVGRPAVSDASLEFPRDEVPSFPPRKSSEFDISLAARADSVPPVESRIEATFPFPRGAKSSDPGTLPLRDADPGPDSLPGWIGKYRVIRELGRGGMGIVYLAEDFRLRRQVAIKTLRPDVARHDTADARFLREAQAMAMIGSDHVIRVYDVGEHDGRPYFVMELLEGYSLDQLIRRRPRLTFSLLLSLGIDFASGIADAHEMGVIHRDIKPANLFVEHSKNRGKVLDFGLTRLRESAELTAEKSFMGTLLYMPLEQAKREPVDHRADIYSLGVVLYQLAAGQLPFEGKTEYEILYALSMTEPIRLDARNTQIPPRFADLVHRMLSKDPASRPQSMLEVVDELVSMRRDYPPPQRSSLDSAAPSEFPGTIPILPTVPPYSARRSKALFFLALAGALLLVGILFKSFIFD